MATALTPVQKATQLRIQKMTQVPGASGMKGFLLWTEAAWPPAIAQKILAAASKHVGGASTAPGTGPVAGLTDSGRQAYPYPLRPEQSSWSGNVAGASLGRFGRFGDLTDLTVQVPIPDVGSDVSQAINDATTTPSATTAATPSAPASAAWVSDITNAIQASATAYLGVQQVKDAQSIFNTNLALAAAGKQMIPTNPTVYGLPAPTANIGLAPSAQSALWVLGGLLVGGAVLASLAKGRRA